MNKTITLLAAVAFFCGGLLAEEEKLSLGEAQQMLLGAVTSLAEKGDAKFQLY